MALWKPLYISQQFFKLLFKFKNPQYNFKFYNKLKKKKYSKKTTPIIFNKSNTIINSLVNESIFIYKGKLLRQLKIPQYSVGLKVGEFCMSRKPFHFTLKIKKKK
jgi:ribosomal protein S19